MSRRMIDEDIQFCIGLAGVQLFAVIVFGVPALFLHLIG